MSNISAFTQCGIRAVEDLFCEKFNNFDDFAKHGFSIEPNNKIDKFTVDFKLFRNGEFYGYLELKSICTQSKCRNFFFNCFNHKFSGPNKIFEEFTAAEAAGLDFWYAVYDWQTNKMVIVKNEQLKKLLVKMNDFCKIKVWDLRDAKDRTPYGKRADETRFPSMRGYYFLSPEEFGKIYVM